MENKKIRLWLEILHKNTPKIVFNEQITGCIDNKLYIFYFNQNISNIEYLVYKGFV